MRLIHPSPPPLPDASTPALTLPPAFEAFYATHVRCYQAYAHAHFTHRDTADAFVRTAFGDLLAHWSALVATLNPSAEAWNRYSAHICRHAPSLPLRTEAPCNTRPWSSTTSPAAPSTPRPPPPARTPARFAICSTPGPASTTSGMGWQSHLVPMGVCDFSR